MCLIGLKACDAHGSSKRGRLCLERSQAAADSEDSEMERMSVMRRDITTSLGRSKRGMSKWAASPHPLGLPHWRLSVEGGSESLARLGPHRLGGLA